MSYQPDTPLAILVRRAQPALPLNAADAAIAHELVEMERAAAGGGE